MRGWLTVMLLLGAGPTLAETSHVRIDNPVPLAQYNRTDAERIGRYPAIATPEMGIISQIAVYKPASLRKDALAPAVVLLHGTHRSGPLMIEMWRPLADREGVVLVAPTFATGRWPTREEFAHFSRLPSVLAEALPVDPARIYLFGHSAGAAAALQIAALRPKVYAAYAAHGSGVWLPQSIAGHYARTEGIPPVVFIIGDRDQQTPVAKVLANAAQFDAAGFPTAVIELAPHNHWYYSAADTINRLAWHIFEDARGGDPDG